MFSLFGVLFPPLLFLNKGMLPFCPPTLTSSQAHYPSNSWTSIQTCHRHCFLKITPPICRKHVLSSQLAPKTPHMQPGNVKRCGSYHPFATFQMLLQIFLCAATRGPSSCLRTLLMVQKGSTTPHPFSKQLRAPRGRRPLFLLGRPSWLCRTSNLHLQLRFPT